MSAVGEATAEPDGIAIGRAGPRVLLKWHKLRRAADQPPFDLANLRAGLALGASLEIDIRRLADGAWVCLHDDLLDEETDGRGRVTALDSAGARRLRIAGAAYAPPLLDEVARVVADAMAASGAAVGAMGAAMLQLDLKEPADRMDDAATASLAAVIGPIASCCVVSGYAWPPLARLRDGIPGLRAGFDPYEMAAGARLASAADFARFTGAVLAEAPEADTFYLYHRFVTAALAAGVNPVAMLQAGGAFVDVWTLDPTTPEIARILPQVVTAGADQITTNAPSALARLWRELSP